MIDWETKIFLIYSSGIENAISINSVKCRMDFDETNEIKKYICESRWNFQEDHSSFGIFFKRILSESSRLTMSSRERFEILLNFELNVSIPALTDYKLVIL